MLIGFDIDAPLGQVFGPDVLAEQVGELVVVRVDRERRRGRLTSAIVINGGRTVRVELDVEGEIP